MYRKESTHWTIYTEIIKQISNNIFTGKKVNPKKLSIETAKKLVNQIEEATKNEKLIVEEDFEENDVEEFDEEIDDEDEEEDDEEHLEEEDNDDEDEEEDDNLEDEDLDDEDFSISSNTFNIFNDADRLDLISKAYSLIMGKSLSRYLPSCLILISKISLNSFFKRLSIRIFQV